MSKHREALDHLARGDWEAAHGLVQDSTDRISCLLHALVHRHEGDASNAVYWYRQAGEPAQTNTLEEEWRRIDKLVRKEAR